MLASPSRRTSPSDEWFGVATGHAAQAVYAGWLWTAPRVPGVRDAGLVEVVMSLAAGVLVGCLLAEGCGWLE
jgi:hypothetical protein